MNEKTKGYIVTAIFHTLLILLLLWMGFTTPLPLPEEEGVEVNLGMDIKGYGKVQKPIKQSPPKRKTPPPPLKPVEKQQEDVVTQDTEETLDVAEPKKEPKKIIPKPKPEPEQKTVEEPVKEPEKIEPEQPKLNPNALYPGKKKNGEGTPSNEGNKKGDGDMGKPNGSKDSKKYDGNSPSGSGMDWSLKGRSVRNMPKPSNDFLEGGIIAIKIKVDQFGKVISAEFTPRGSTSTDSHLKKLAVRAALKCRFNVNKDAPETQQGIIKYRFTVGG